MSEYTILWPKDNIDPKKKDNNWLSQIGRAIFYRYENNKTYFGRQDIARLFEIRNYSEGRQSQQKYIDMWVARGDEKSNNSTPNAQAQRIRRKGYANIKSDNPDAVGVLPGKPKLSTDSVGSVTGFLMM